jgi:hypothetical protein
MLGIKRRKVMTLPGTSAADAAAGQSRAESRPKVFISYRAGTWLSPIGSAWR